MRLLCPFLNSVKMGHSKEQHHEHPSNKETLDWYKECLQNGKVSEEIFKEVSKCTWRSLLTFLDKVTWSTNEFMSTNEKPRYKTKSYESSPIPR